MIGQHQHLRKMGTIPDTEESLKMNRYMEGHTDAQDLFQCHPDIIRVKSITDQHKPNNLL